MRTRLLLLVAVIATLLSGTAAASRAAAPATRARLVFAFHPF